MITFTPEIKGANFYVEGVLDLDGTKFKANSGGWGKGALPAGKYKIGAARLLHGLPDKNAYKKDWESWWCPIEPMFKTERTSLGIHPDGNVKGTLGCIGINETNGNDRHCFMLLCQLMGQILTVEDYNV
jgi:hypothetical protein